MKTLDSVSPLRFGVKVAERRAPFENTQPDMRVWTAGKQLLMFSATVTLASAVLEILFCGGSTTGGALRSDLGPVAADSGSKMCTELKVQSG